MAVVPLMLPFGRTENTPGSVPLGIQEKLTRSSITRKNGRSAAFLAVLTGRSALLADPAEASAVAVIMVAVIIARRNDISNTPC